MFISIMTNIPSMFLVLLKIHTTWIEIAQKYPGKKNVSYPNTEQQKIERESCSFLLYLKWSNIAWDKLWGNNSTQYSICRNYWV